MKSTHILGLNLSHLGTAALLKDGQIIACASEERFTGVKNQSGFPKNAVKFCLDFVKIKDQDLDCVAVADYKTEPVFLKNSSKDPLLDNPQLEWLFLAQLNLEMKFPILRDLSYKLYRIVQDFKRGDTKPQRIKLLQKFLKVSSSRFIFVDHHTCHGLVALYCSGFNQKLDRILIFTADGVGDDASATLSIFENGKIQRLYTNPSQNSLGFFYLHITQYLGLKPIEDEYKVMGLAPYSQKNSCEVVYKKLKKFILEDQKNLIWRFRVNEILISKILPKLLKFSRFDAIAGAAQKILEECLELWVKSNVKTLKCPNLVFGGGVFANVKANLKIAKLKEVRNAYFSFSPGDESNALGAAFYAYEKLMQKEKLPKLNPVTNLYWGPSFSKSEVQDAISQNNIEKFCNIQSFKNINRVVARLLARGGVVARFAGRMEYGTRALGNRSILADPSKKELVDFINSAIKNRDFWMPFAPTIIKERVNDYLIPHKADSPFMNVAFDTTKKAQKELIAAIHPADKTTRPQILSREDNPSYWELIKEFEKLTRIGAILNTSFNLHGEPIVCSPGDALRVFLESQLKYLALENLLIIKMDQAV